MKHVDFLSSILFWFLTGFAFEIDYSDRALTGSFDKTAKLWNVFTGDCLVTFWGHTAEVVGAQFNPSKETVATISMDSTARVFDVITGRSMYSCIILTNQMKSAQLFCSLIINLFAIHQVSLPFSTIKENLHSLFFLFKIFRVA